MFSGGIERSKLVDCIWINTKSCFDTLKRFSYLSFERLFFFFILQKHVEGKTCSKCKVGYFNLQEANPDGCTPCFCNGLTKHCRSANFGRKQVRVCIRLKFQKQSFADVFQKSCSEKYRNINWKAPVLEPLFKT